MTIGGSQKSARPSLAAVRRRAVEISEETLVAAAALRPDSQLPLAMTPAVPGVDLAEWASRHREVIESSLMRHGGILFRGFRIDGAEQFERVVAAITSETLEYRERSSPRTQISHNIYTSTDYPPDQSIFLHNENSYQRVWPLKIFFCCQTPAREGGATPIADCRLVYEHIDPAVRQRFAEKGWMYVRNFSSGVGLPWQTVFQTSDRKTVAEYCRANDITVEWLPGDRLRTRAQRRAVARHPRTGEWVWFNHAAFFHVSTLAPSIRDGMLAEYAEPDLPANSFYGDGTPIEPDVVEMLRQAYRSATVAFPWEKGDVLLLDNMLVAHGRAPFVGPRKVLVSMAEPYEGER